MAQDQHFLAGGRGTVESHVYLRIGAADPDLENAYRYLALARLQAGHIDDTGAVGFAGLDGEGLHGLR